MSIQCFASIAESLRQRVAASDDFGNVEKIDHIRWSIGLIGYHKQIIPIRVGGF